MVWCIHYFQMMFGDNYLFQIGNPLFSQVGNSQFEGYPFVWHHTPFLVWENILIYPRNHNYRNRMILFLLGVGIPFHISCRSNKTWKYNIVLVVNTSLCFRKSKYHAL